MAGTAACLDLLTFAYLSLPPQPSGKPKLISNYPARWTAHYLQNRYQTVDPVFRARCGGCRFRWGSDMRGFATSQVQQRLFEEAAELWFDDPDCRSPRLPRGRKRLPDFH
ncbi:autoinducer binding domain-containing protein [Mesorhizobium sp. L103C131B0]|uniref:autoinducer binding domain-containing protein n=1 Tax=Mesorhizobium sp. L103C131B0 TaxID=1287089 RepID=UPI001FD9BABA|nr:autoinducer binding domain-containing protein [Mesorhizobium sp. L103C131B0]